MQLFSFLLSIIIHIFVALVIIFMPDGTSNIMKPEDSYQVSLVMGTPGGENLASPVLGIRAPTAPKEAQAKPTPTQVAENTPKQPTPTPAPAPEIPKVDVPEQPKPEVKQTPKPESKTQNIPEPPKEPTPPENAVAVSERRKEEDTKKAPETKDKEKQEQPKPKPTPAPTPAPAPKPTKSADDILKSALADANKQANTGNNKTENSQTNKNSNALASALTDIKKQVNSQGGGGGGQGSGEGGGGIYDVYAAQVLLAIRPNWSFTNATRDNYVVQVKITIEPSGKVLSYEILQRSGRSDYDAAAVNAIVRTETLPPPPNADLQTLIINFNSSELR